MAEKKKATTKAAPSRKAATRKAAKGDKYVCEVCGLGFVIDDACGCAEFDLLCCGEPMTAKKAPVKAR